MYYFTRNAAAPPSKPTFGENFSYNFFKLWIGEPPKIAGYIPRVAWLHGSCNSEATAMSSKVKKASQAAATPVKEKAEKAVAPVQKKEAEEEDLSGISTVLPI